MGIVNTSPDSFSGDGVSSTEAAVAQAKQMLADGADILDIGGESTRPGSESISIEEELQRVIPVVEQLVKETDVILSVDTYKPEIAEAALQAGAYIINDITGLGDARMAPLVAHYKAGLVIMHMQGTPKTMQQNPQYTDVIEDIKAFFQERITKAKQAGVADEQIMVDPGIGFGKTLEHNLSLIKNLKEFHNPFMFRAQQSAVEKQTQGTCKPSVLDPAALHSNNNYVYPILLGTSRKGFIGKLTGKDNPQDRILGTAASVAIGIVNGADIVRVHDIQAMKDVIAVVDSLK